MRRIFLVILALALVWCAYMVSPYLALYDTARAVEARDVERMRARIDFDQVRREMAGQIAQALLGTGPEGPLGQTGSRAIRSTIDPLLEPILSPEAIARLLSAQGGGIAGEVAGAHPLPADMFASLDRIWGYFRESEFRGFRAFVAQVPPERPAAERFRIILRLSSGSWRVVGIQLPAELRDRIVENIKRGTLARGAN